MLGGLVAKWREDNGTVRPARDSGLIPTWQVGQEQSAGINFRKLAKDGYESNSLIYACIREKATSFAALTPHIQRADGKIVANHRLAKLLMNPNSTQDGYDFAETAMTYLEATGQAYLQKVRVSANPARRSEFATYPVQELRLIRSDYVSIKPGLTWEQDRFLVTIDGEVRESIPRSDMIHIHEPSLTNDFYGLSKIAVLQREGAIDLEMSDFELSFFRNAGVPMGLLKVKGSNFEQEDAERTKLAFRKAYNGFKKWFDLLVLNADTADYIPMGTKQSDMEMDSTRFHVESRICSVFGVPPIIVGARIALANSMPYEDAEHSFWAETMVPDTLRFARAWTKFLLPEFATGADRDAEVGYDFTVVRALQEDRSRKLREVVRMIGTGGFTVNQALTIVGLPAQDEGDFYVRNGNQVIVMADGTVVPMAPNSQPGKNPDNPLVGAASLNEEAAVAEALTIFQRR